jgi:hypothetical protein
MSENEAVQEQFDWQKETAKCVEGLKFDLDQDYKFELDYDDVSLHTIAKKLPDGTFEPILYKKGENKDQPIKMYTFPFKETETTVTFKTEFFHNKTYRVNPQNPELEDAIVKFSRKLGYNPMLDGDFSVPDFIKPGIVITARLMYQQPTEKGYSIDEKTGMVLNAAGKEVRKAYKTIDIDTIVLGEGGSGGETQEALEKVEPAVQKEIQDLAKGCKKFAELVTKINKAKLTDKLLDPAMKMKEQGLLKF